MNINNVTAEQIVQTVYKQYGNGKPLRTFQEELLQALEKEQKQSSIKPVDSKLNVYLDMNNY